MKSGFFIVILMLLSVNSFSANAWVAIQINEILIHDDATSDFNGRVHVKMMTEMEGEPPACVDATLKKYFAIDLSRNASSSQYSALLAAKIAGKAVTVQINQACVPGGIAIVRNVTIF
jgi:hypothetical protein